MSEKTWTRNTAGLVAHAHQRKEEKRKRVEETITRLLREHQAVNFNTIAKAAGVSKPTCTLNLFSESVSRHFVNRKENKEYVNR